MPLKSGFDHSQKIKQLDFFHNLPQTNLKECTYDDTFKTALKTDGFPAIRC